MEIYQVHQITFNENNEEINRTVLMSSIYRSIAEWFVTKYAIEHPHVAEDLQIVVV